MLRRAPGPGSLAAAYPDQFVKDVVANGTPAELKARHDLAGTVTLRVHGVAAETVRGRLGNLNLVSKVTAQEDRGSVTARVYPRTKAANGDRANSVAETVGKEGWRFDELHTEDGRLDEVFRAITSPDTAAAKA